MVHKQWLPIDVSIENEKNAMGTNNNGNIENHIRDILWSIVTSPKRINQLGQSPSKRICQTHHSGSSNSSTVGEPKIRVPGWGCKDKRLREASEDLSKHHSTKIAMRAGSCRTISYPIA